MLFLAFAGTRLASTPVTSSFPGESSSGPKRRWPSQVGLGRSPTTRFRPASTRIDITLAPEGDQGDQPPHGHIAVWARWTL